MSALEEIEAIQRLKHRYLRCLDLKLWEEMRELFAPGARSANDGGRRFFAASLKPEIVTLHQVHHPEIELTGPTTATGLWYLSDFGINPGPAHFGFRARSRLWGAAFYRDEYVKLDGQWRIAFTGYERSFEVQQDLGDAPGWALHSRWSPLAG
jgi:hypothetical protein